MSCRPPAGGVGLQPAHAPTVVSLQTKLFVHRGGGPSVDREGKVLRVSFGESIDEPDTVFVMTANEIAPQVGGPHEHRAGGDRSRTVLTRRWYRPRAQSGSCRR